ncbi:MAG: hypothetical protein KC621_11310 [Myxococcales bacterium]|nr:hypothetical protein [Myxococcales bacterium]
MSDAFDIKGTQSRPAWLPFFVLASNNLYASVDARPDALIVKVITTNVLPWSRITRVRDTTTLIGYGLGITCDGWEYIVHLHEASERQRLRERLRAEGVPTA